MKQHSTLLAAAGLLALTTGCASSYTPIRPDKIATYQSSSVGGPVDLGYQFDVLRLRGANKKYVKKEAKKGYHVAAVRVTNNTERELNFSRDMQLMYGDRPAVAIPSTSAAADLKQGVAIYALYILLNPTVGIKYDQLGRPIEGTGTTFYVGPLIAGGNMLGASGANKNLRKEFEAHDLTNRNIKPGETVYGIVSVREQAVAPMRIELRSGAISTYTPGAVPLPTPPASSPLRSDQ